MRTVLDVVGVCLLAAVLFIVLVAFRRRWLSRDGGTFDCSLQLAEKEAAGLLGPLLVDVTVEWLA